jgi:hypothetical protein
MKKYTYTLAMVALSYCCYAQTYLPLTAGSGNTLTNTLYINNSTSTGVGLQLDGTAYGGHIWQFGDGLTTNGTFSIKDATTGLERLAITNTGNVGIGTLSPYQFTTKSINTTGITIASFVNGNNEGLFIGHAGSGGLYGPSNSVTIGADYIGGGAYRSLSLLTSEQPRLTIDVSGNVGIGTTSPDQKLTVKGTIHSQEVIVDMSVLPDYVFKPAYHLRTLTEVKTYIDQNHRLPEMPSAEQVAKDGLGLGDMNAKLLKKVEELTLYLIEKDNKDKEKDEQINILQDELIQLKQSQQKEINELKQQVSTLIKPKP